MLVLLTHSIIMTNIVYTYIILAVMKGHLAGIPKLLQVLRLGPLSFHLHSSPNMLNNHIWRLCWPPLKDLDLIPPEKLYTETGGMARSSILLKNLTPLVVRNGRQESVDIWHHLSGSLTGTRCRSRELQSRSRLFK